MFLLASLGGNDPGDLDFGLGGTWDVYFVYEVGGCGLGGPATAKGPYFEDGSTAPGDVASKPPAYPAHRMTKGNAKL